MQQNKLFLVGGGIVIVIILLILAFIRPWTMMTSTSVSQTGYAGDDMAMYDGGGALGVVAPSKMMALDAREESFRIAEPSPSTGSVNSQTPTDERLIIKTGSLSLVVQEVSLAIDTIATFAKEKGGFVVSSSLSPAAVAPSGNVTIRIPVDVFDSGLSTIRGLGEVEQEQVYGQDVTEEFVDLEAQLGNLRATETQFLDIMKRATRIEDVLAVQRELTWVRRDIEQIEGRMKYLTESAAFSTLTIYLATDPDVLPVIEDESKWKPLGVVKDALRSLVLFAQQIGNAVIWFVVYIPLWALLFGLGYMGWKKMKSKMVK